MLENDWLYDSSWYKNNIEKPVRKIVKNLRNQGINTQCSCGHRLYIQCGSIDIFEELRTIYNVLVTMNIDTYQVILYENCIDSHKHTCLEIMLPDENGEYYCETKDNPKFTRQKWED